MFVINIFIIIHFKLQTFVSGKKKSSNIAFSSDKDQNYSKQIYRWILMTTRDRLFNWTKLYYGLWTIIFIRRSNVLNLKCLNDRFVSYRCVRVSIRSSYASLIVLAKKKDGTLHMCVDYRQLNNCKRRFPSAADRGNLALADRGPVDFYHGPR